MELIDETALIAELEKRRSKNARNKLNLAASFEDNYLLSFLDTLETKMVDLVKEYDDNFSNDPVYSKHVNRNAGIGIAKHFFNLGLRTQEEGFKKDCETEYPNFDEAQGTSFIKTK